MKVRLLRDLYRYEGDTRLVFAEQGQILETGPLSDDVDSMVGCLTARLVEPLDGGRVSLLGEGYDFEAVDLRPGTRVVA